MKTNVQYDEEGGRSSSKKSSSGGGGGGGGNGLREVTYRPSIHSKSTTCLGGCTERRGSAVSSSVDIKTSSTIPSVPHLFYSSTHPTPTFTIHSNWISTAFYCRFAVAIIDWIFSHTHKKSPFSSLYDII